MKTRFIAIALCALCFTSALPARAAELSGKECLKTACFEKNVRLGNQSIGLLGVGRFRYLIFDVYTAALYAPENLRRTGKLDAEEATELVIEYHRSISARELRESALSFLEKQNSFIPREVRANIDKLHDAYLDVKEGDRYQLRYQPGLGTSLSLNGKELIAIPSHLFAEYYFRIWLDAGNPIDPELRAKLIGL